MGVIKEEARARRKQAEGRGSASPCGASELLQGGKRTLKLFEKIGHLAPAKMCPIPDSWKLRKLLRSSECRRFIGMCSWEQPHEKSKTGHWGKLSFDAVAAQEPLIAEVSLAAELRLQGARASVLVARGLRSCSSWAPEHKLSSCSTWSSCSTVQILKDLL